MKHLDIILNSDAPTLHPENDSLHSQGDWLSNFLLAAGHAPEQLPLAELLARYHKLQGQWLVMSPILWQATHNDAMIVSFGADLHLSEAESRDLFAKVADFIAEDGLQLHYHNAGTWLVEISRKPVLTTPSISFMQHKSMMYSLSAMDKSMFWQKLLTELQMLLSSGQKVNGVWIHGQGQADLNIGRPVFTDDARLHACFPDKIQMFSSTESIKNNSILVLGTVNAEILSALQQRQARWYWNNTAYITGKKSWWKRMISCR